MAGTDRQTDGEILERTRQETKKPELFKVLLLNDDYTTMDFVVEILENDLSQAAGRGVPDHDDGAHAGQGALRRVSARGGRNEGRDGRSSARGRTASRCGPPWNRSRGLRSLRL